MTPEAFRAAYVSGDKDINRLYKALSINESLPFETGDINQFSQDFFGVVKKKKKLNQPTQNQLVRNHHRRILPSDLLGLLPRVQLRWANKRVEIRISL